VVGRGPYRGERAAAFIDTVVALQAPICDAGPAPCPQPPRGSRARRLVVCRPHRGEETRRFPGLGDATGLVTREPRELGAQLVHCRLLAITEKRGNLEVMECRGVLRPRVCRRVEPWGRGRGTPGSPKERRPGAAGGDRFERLDHLLAA
jgi:hypothetical protein